MNKSTVTYGLLDIQHTLKNYTLLTVFWKYIDSYILQRFLSTHHEHLPSPLSFRDDISTGHCASTQSSNWSTCRVGSEFTHSSRNCTSSVALCASVPTTALLDANSSGAFQQRNTPFLINSIGKLQLQLYEIALAIPLCM